MTQIQSFADVHKFLGKYIFDNGKKSGSYSLERMRALMSELGNPQDSYKVVHIAGTSGKTSTCYYTAALLVEEGQKVGMTVSPYVDEINERVQINLISMPEAEFCAELQEFVKVVEATTIKPTYFELLVAFAFWEFARQQVDYAVVEVGLGGLLDGTNVINRPDKVCVITDIGMDHTDILGNTITKIAAQKAGIIQDHNSVFIYDQGLEVMEQVKSRCKQTHASLHLVEPSTDQTFKQRNFFLAHNVIDFIAQNETWPELSSNQLQKVESITVPARMEELSYQGKKIIIDGSHNAQKMEAMVQDVSKLYPKKSVVVLVSLVDSEARRAPDTLNQLKNLTSKVIVTSFGGEQDSPKRSLSSKQIANLAKQVGFGDIQVIDKPQQAFQVLLKQPEDILVVTGSFYLLNHIRPLLKG